MSGDVSENEDGILLMPEGEAGVCVWVQSWCNRCRIVVARGSDGWDALDEELSDGEWELPSHVPPIRLGGSKGFKPAPASMPPVMHPPTVNLNGHGGGLMPLWKSQDAADRETTIWSLGGSILIHACRRALFKKNFRCWSRRVICNCQLI